MSIGRVFTLSKATNWWEVMTKLPPEQQDVYFTPAYYCLYANHRAIEAMCYVFEQDGKCAIYPFLLNKINDLGYNLDADYYDVQGAYGYNGVATNCQEQDFINAFSAAWLAWAKQHNVVAEFIRYNPVLRNEQLCPWAPPIDVLDNVLIHLTNHEDIWKNSYDRGVRQAVHKAEKHNLAFTMQVGREITDTVYAKFVELYIETMQRRQADGFYFFNQEYFVKLREYLADYLLMVYVEYEGEIISIDLYLHNNISVYGFLSGTKSEYFKLSPNSLLRDETIKALIARGFKTYSIGGGLSRHDSVFKYKKSFSINNESQFYIGRKIHNEQVYGALTAQWEQRVGEKAADFKHLLLKYRYGI